MFCPSSHIAQGIVKKRRLLYLVGQTRVHCDDVEGLGHFMELEVCCNPSLHAALCVILLNINFKNKFK